MRSLCEVEETEDARLRQTENSVVPGARVVWLEGALEERSDLLRGNVRALAVVEVHVRGAVDDDEFLILRSGLGVQLLAVPERARFATGDHQSGWVTNVSAPSKP